MKFKAGEVIAGRYRIVAFHLEGGMQEVYRCSDLTLERVVALKTPREGIVDKRFSRGAQMGARVVHPNVAATLDYVEEGANRCIVEEFIEGKDLGRRLESEFFFLDPSLTAWVVHNIAKGLQAAHRVGICHRDLKPSNIMTSADGHFDIIKLTDFGIAKLAEKELEAEIEKFEQNNNTLTSSSTLLGAVPYLAPECWSDWSSVGQPADIWALGAIACHLLHGKPPFGAGKGAIMKMAQAQLTGKIEVSPPEWFSKHQETAQLEQELWALVQGCLQIDPALRIKADEALQRCEALCYSATPRKTGVVETYPLKYRNGGTATAGYISVDGGGSVFFHRSEFFSAGVKPQVGQRVNFSKAAGKPNERCSPVLLLKNP
ncbi:MAG: serine/threonine protein kinase [Burkholderiales bacterium]|jgi:serine/threonine-protein kinase|nr:serine/threonine protein kinase [Burkholderiales bacterium]